MLDYLFKNGYYDDGSFLSGEELVKVLDERGFLSNVTIDNKANTLVRLEEIGLLKPVFKVMDDGSVERIANEWQKSAKNIDDYKNQLARHLWELGLIYEPSRQSVKAVATWINSNNQMLGPKEATRSYYSLFQLYWLDELLKLSTIDPVTELTRNVALREVGPPEKLEWIHKRTDRHWPKFYKFLKFTSAVYPLYCPYIQSGGGVFTRSIRSDQTEQERSLMINRIQSNIRMIASDLEIDAVGDLSFWYSRFTSLAINELGCASNESDWLRLWMGVLFEKKGDLRGRVRLGIEYLQWAVMLKPIIEDLIDREVADVDEIGGFHYESIVDIELNRWGGPGVRSFKNFLNMDISDKEFDLISQKLDLVASHPADDSSKSGKEAIDGAASGFYIDWDKRGVYFDDKDIGVKNLNKDGYKMRYYLANSFGVDYTPRMIVFVEGMTEEVMVPKFMKLARVDVSLLGIHIKSIDGISNLYRRSNSKDKVGWINNFQHLIDYNLSKWQILPFFLLDAEGDVQDQLDNWPVTTLDSQKYTLNQNKLCHLWGKSNRNKPRKGNSFEMANYTDGEISRAINKFHAARSSGRRTIEWQDIRVYRNQGLSIGQIYKKFYSHKLGGPEKMEVNEILFDSVGKLNDKTQRPILQACKLIVEGAVLNHRPKARFIEVKNLKSVKDDFLHPLP